MYSMFCLPYLLHSYLTTSRVTYLFLIRENIRLYILTVAFFEIVLKPNINHRGGYAL